ARMKGVFSLACISTDQYLHPKTGVDKTSDDPSRSSTVKIKVSHVSWKHKDLHKSRVVHVRVLDKHLLDEHLFGSHPSAGPRR
ncbi:hypothetical protein, partial [Rhodopirellula bahusiensis]